MFVYVMVNRVGICEGVNQGLKVVDGSSFWKTTSSQVIPRRIRTSCISKHCCYCIRSWYSDSPWCDNMGHNLCWKNFFGGCMDSVAIENGLLNFFGSGMDPMAIESRLLIWIVGLMEVQMWPSLANPRLANSSKGSDSLNLRWRGLVLGIPGLRRGLKVPGSLIPKATFAIFPLNSGFLLDLVIFTVARAVGYFIGSLSKVMVHIIPKSKTGI